MTQPNAASREGLRASLKQRYPDAHKTAIEDIVEEACLAAPSLRLAQAFLLAARSLQFEPAFQGTGGRSTFSISEPAGPRPTSRAQRAVGTKLVLR